MMNQFFFSIFFFRSRGDLIFTERKQFALWDARISLKRFALLALGGAKMSYILQRCVALAFYMMIVHSTSSAVKVSLR
jgi:hypothetical protein